MIARTFLEFFKRDIAKLREEITLFPDERLWRVNGEIKNPAGNLALHVTGNLKHFIGAVLGGTGYVRQRDSEFSEKEVSKEKLLQGLNEAETVVTKVLSTLADEKLIQPYPMDTFGKNSTTLHALIQLASHLSYHLGQVNYLRRMG